MDRRWSRENDAISASATAPREPLYEDDDYLRFLLSLGDDNALPEEDDDDPDFDADMRKLLDELSEDERNVVGFPDVTETALLSPRAFSNWELPLERAPSPHPMRFLRSPSDRVEHPRSLDELSPAWCTRSRYPMNTLDIEDLEGRLFPYVDDTTLDELPEFGSVEDLRPMHMEFDLHDPCRMLDTQPRYLGAAHPEAKPLKRRTGSFVRRVRHHEPHSDFADIFPSHMFNPERCDSSCGGLSTTLLDPGWMEMHVNTLSGVMRMQTDAWTPKMILCLNRIVNAHTQLLIQSFAACLGLPHLRETAEEMHAQLHSMYQLCKVQADFDFGYVTMLKKEVPALLPLHTKLPQTVDHGQRGRKRTRPPPHKRKKRQGKTSVEVVIDLTEENTQDESETAEHSLSSVLDVPLLHVLPHLWQALMVISFTKQGIFFDSDEWPVEGSSRRFGYLPTLRFPRIIQRVMKLMDGMMTCGLRASIVRHDPVSRGHIWSPTELSLLSYAVQRHNEDHQLIKTQYLPSKNYRTLAKQGKKARLDFDKNWKRIEKFLMDTDAVSLLQPDLSHQVEKSQSQLISLCHEFRRSRENVVSSNRVNINPPPAQNAALLNVLQGVVKNSTSRLVEQVFGHHSPSASSRAGNTAVMQNLMCLLLGQIGSQLAGSFDTLFTMMSVVAGMQLINGAELQGALTQPEMIELAHEEPDEDGEISF